MLGAAGAGAEDDGTVDLLAEVRAALAARAGAPLLLCGYCEPGPHLSLNLADGHQARLSAAPDTGIVVESDWPAWLSFEGWLPAGPLTGLRLSIAATAERDFWVDPFVRLIAPDGPGEDAPAVRLTVGNPATPAAEVVLTVPPDDGRRRKLVVLMSRPPARLILRRLTLRPDLPPPGATPS